MAFTMVLSSVIVLTLPANIIGLLKKIKKDEPTGYYTIYFTVCFAVLWIFLISAILAMAE